MSRISRKLREKIIQAARNRCGYCQTPQDLVPIPFEIERDEENAEKSCGEKFAGNSQRQTFECGRAKIEKFSNEIPNLSL